MNYIEELTRIGNQLDCVDLAVNPEKARSLLRRRRAIQHRLEQGRKRSQLYQARSRDIIPFRPRHTPGGYAS